MLMPRMPAVAGGLDVARQPVYAQIVEAHAVDHRLRLGQAEHAWARVAGLRSRGDGAHLQKPKAQAGQRIDVGAVLVQAGGQPDAVGERKSHQPDRRRFRYAVRKQPPAGIEQREGEVVGGLGVEPEQRRPRQLPDHSGSLNCGSRRSR